MNLDELKKKLLAALPPALREKMGVHLEEEDDEDIDVDSDEPTASHDISEMGEGDEDDDDEEDEDDEEAQKQAKRSKIIRAIAILAVIFFAADEFLNTEEEIIVPDVPVKMSPAKKAMLEAKKKAEEEAKLAAEQAALATPEPIETEEPIVEETISPEVEETPIVVEVPPETPPEILNFEDEPIPEPTPEIVVTPDFMENIGQTSVPTEATPAANDNQENTLDALMQAVDKSGKLAESNMKNQLGRNDPSYVEPPNYLRTGRGLVYNCKEGHWACVDKFSYFTCFENQKWNEENAQSAECVTRDVYASGADCAAIQKFYVNKPEPTDFCGKSETIEVKVEEQSEPEDLSNLLAP